MCHRNGTTADESIFKVWNGLGVDGEGGHSESEKANLCSKALRKEFSTPKLRQNCGKAPYSVQQWIGNLILPHVDPKMSSLGLLEAKIIPK